MMRMMMMIITFDFISSVLKFVNSILICSFDLIGEANLQQNVRATPQKVTKWENSPLKHFLTVKLLAMLVCLFE